MFITRSTKDIESVLEQAVKTDQPTIHPWTELVIGAYIPDDMILPAPFDLFNDTYASTDVTDFQNVRRIVSIVSLNESAHYFIDYPMTNQSFQLYVDTIKDKTRITKLSELLVTHELSSCIINRIREKIE